MKPYVKPELHYENFELSQSVAACGYPLRHTENDCTLYDENIFATVFTDTNSGCEIDYKDTEFYCATNGSDQNRIFNS